MHAPAVTKDKCPLCILRILCRIIQDIKDKRNDIVYRTSIERGLVLGCGGCIADASRVSPCSIRQVRVIGPDSTGLMPRFSLIGAKFPSVIPKWHCLPSKGAVGYELDQDGVNMQHACSRMTDIFFDLPDDFTTLVSMLHAGRQIHRPYGCR